MQEITEHYRNDRISEIIKAQFVAEESDKLSERFRNNELAALNRASERADRGDRVTISVRTSRNIQMTDDCPCGSGEQLQRCCGRHMEQGRLE